MIVIHIGLRKAGSTAIQSFLSANADALRDIGVEYPVIGRQLRVDHNNLANDLKKSEHFDPKFGTIAELIEYWKTCGNHTLILSGETFEECELEDTVALKEILDSLNDDVRIVMIVRELIDLTPSSYSQQVKYGNSLEDFDTFFERRMQQRRVRVNKTAKRWGDVFGWDRMHIRTLDPRFLVNGDLVDDLLTAAGLDAGSEVIRSMERPGPANVAPGWRVLEALRGLYDGSAGLPADHPLADPNSLSSNSKKMLGVNAIELGDRWGWNKDKGLYLTEEQARRSITVHTESIKRLNRMVSQKLPVPLALEDRHFTPRKFLPDYSHIAGKRLDAFYDKLATMPLTWRPGIA